MKTLFLMANRKLSKTTPSYSMTGPLSSHLNVSYKPHLHLVNLCSMFLLFLRLPEKGTRPEWKFLSVNNSGILSVVVHGL